MIKSRALVLGSISAFVVVGGIILSILLYQMLRNAIEGHSNVDSSQINISLFSEGAGPLWAFGLVYVIPGILGFIAALCQKKWLYVITAIFAIISLIIMVLIFIFAGLALVILIIAFGSVSEICKDTPQGCRCRTDDDYRYEYQDSGFRSCSYFSTFIGLLIAMFIFIILTWIALLTLCITACYYACRSQPSSHGTVYTPAQQPMMPMHQDHPPQYPPPGYTYPPGQQQYYGEPPQSKA